MARADAEIDLCGRLMHSSQIALMHRRRLSVGGQVMIASRLWVVLRERLSAGGED